jgi:hypothetical protein
MQVYVMCPFCSRVFDSLKEPHTVLRIDGQVRTAHAACVKLAPVHVADASKPNGPDPTVTTS